MTAQETVGEGGIAAQGCPTLTRADSVACQEGRRRPSYRWMETATALHESAIKFSLP